jgi:hypothetical protein
MNIVKNNLPNDEKYLILIKNLFHLHDKSSAQIRKIKKINQNHKDY